MRWWSGAPRIQVNVIILDLHARNTVEGKRLAAVTLNPANNFLKGIFSRFIFVT